MIPNPMLFSLLLVFAIIFSVLLIMSLSHKLLDRRAKVATGNLSQEITSALIESPYCHMLADSEKKKYCGKSGLYGLGVYLFILIVTIFISYRDSGSLSITMCLLITSPVALIILLLVIRDILRFSPGKNIYRIKAFCTSYIPGRPGYFSFAYFNFIAGHYDGSCVERTVSINRLNIAPGHFCELIVTPGKNGMHIIDVA